MNAPSDPGSSRVAPGVASLIASAGVRRRPPELWAGAAAITAAVVPVAVLGLLLVVEPSRAGVDLWRKITGAEPGTSLTVLAAVLRVSGLLLVVLAVAFGALVWLTLRPSRGARLLSTVLVALEVLVLAFAMGSLSPGPVSVLTLVLAAVGTVLLYLPRSDAFISSGGRRTEMRRRLARHRRRRTWRGG
ncbi:MAG: hypothetical protein QOE32_1275 [Pseudonocardiales bacterium]|nr:hypothetical protein [Pseudonocardiales bacterium]